MSFIRNAILLLSWFSLTAAAETQTIEIFEQFDQARIVAFIDTADIDAASRWDPLSSPPPLSISGLIDTLRKADAELAIVEIELRQIPHHPGYWHYLVKTQPGLEKQDPYRYFVVLMNGKLIPAIREPESYK